MVHRYVRYKWPWDYYIDFILWLNVCVICLQEVAQLAGTALNEAEVTSLSPPLPLVQTSKKKNVLYRGFGSNGFVNKV
jgi:hypothetical protein